MGMIEGFVSRAQGELDSVAQSSFGAVLDGMGTLAATMATLAVVMLGVNMVLQYRHMSAGQIVVTFIKLIAIGSIGLVWGQFNLIASAVEGGVDSIAANLLGKFGGGEVPSSNLAAAIDNFLSVFSEKANEVMEPMGWMGGAVMSVTVVVEESPGDAHTLSAMSPASVMAPAPRDSVGAPEPVPLSSVPPRRHQRCRDISRIKGTKIPQEGLGMP